MDLIIYDSVLISDTLKISHKAYGTKVTVDFLSIVRLHACDGTCTINLILYLQLILDPIGISADLIKTNCSLCATIIL